MMLEMYAIKDKLDGFTVPIPMPNEAVAQRWYQAMQEQNSDMKHAPDDFKLYYMGKFNKENGEFESEVREL